MQALDGGGFGVTMGAVEFSRPVKAFCAFRSDGTLDSCSVDFNTSHESIDDAELAQDLIVGALTAQHGTPDLHHFGECSKFVVWPGLDGPILVCMELLPDEEGHDIASTSVTRFYRQK